MLRLHGIGWWIIGGLLALGLYDYAKDQGGLSSLGLGEVPWEHIEATSYEDDCVKAGEATYMAIGEKDGAVLSFERPCSQPPPEDKR